MAGETMGWMQEGNGGVQAAAYGQPTTVGGAPKGHRLVNGPQVQISSSTYQGSSDPWYAGRFY